MLARFPPWKITLILLTLAIGCILCLPNFVPRQYLGPLQTNSMKLGLDLQGGASMLFEVDPDDLRANTFQSLSREVRTELTKSPVIAATREAKPNELIVRLLRADQTGEAIRRIQKLGDPPAGQVGQGNRFLVQDRGAGQISVTITPQAFERLQLDAIKQSLENVRRRADPTGTLEPNIQPQGNNRIVVEVPGLSDPVRLQALIDVLTQAGVLTFKMVDEQRTQVAQNESALPVEQQTFQPNVPVEGFRLLPMVKGASGEQGLPLVLEDTAIIEGKDLSNANQGYDEQNRPDINFQMHPSGAKRFGEASTANIGRRFAIVLDNQIISAPVIQSAITGGSGRITGNFTIQEAQNLALILKSGQLSAKLKVVERRVISASLGKDSITKGVTASLVGLVLVTLFMLAAYGLLGCFAIVALFFNVALLIGSLSLIGATLTLPGIAGILLTIGMAVDANVLIFERIREEKRNGRSPVSSCDIGYDEASATIFDANFTHFLAGSVMYFLGSGPIKGFALTLVVGILSSFFTAVIMARLIMALWLQWFRPKSIPI
jgi:protein-export membrane protein SecD